MNPEIFGLPLSEKTRIQTIFSAILKPNYDYKIYVFGSRALGTHRQYSDVDLLVESKPPVSQSQLDQIKELIEKTDTPFVYDLVTLETLKPEYAQKIHTDKKLWF